MDNGPQYAVTVGVAFTFIGIFTKAKVERRNKTDLKDYFKNISLNTNEISKTVLKISKTGAAAETVADSMIKLKESLEGSNLGLLKRELGELSEVMKTYVDATKNSSNFVQSIAEHLNEQSKAITELNKKLSESSVLQTRAYQKASLDNDREQARILAENTQRITEMRNAFDEFLDKMTSVFSEKLIDALNSSIQDIFLFIGLAFLFQPKMQKVNAENLKKAIYVDLRAAFTEDEMNQWGAEIDEKTMAIVFKEPDVLFDVGKSYLKTR